MKIIEHDPTRFTAAGMSYLKDGDEVRLLVKGRRGEIAVKIGAQGLIFTPERSDKHALVLKLLGEET